VERCLGKGKNITYGIALIIQVPYFVSLSRHLSLPIATAPRLLDVGCVGCVSTINVPTESGNP
jgi:hypothetical protein